MKRTKYKHYTDRKLNSQFFIKAKTQKPETKLAFKKLTREEREAAFELLLLKLARLKEGKQTVGSK